MGGKSVLKLRATTPVKKKKVWGGEGEGGQKRGTALVKSQNIPRLKGRSAVQHSVLNKQASSGGQLEPFPPPSCSEPFCSYPPPSPPPKRGDTRERKRTMGVDFPGRSERKGKERAELLLFRCPTVTFPHVHLAPPKKLLILPLHVIGYSSYRFNLSCSTATNSPQAAPLSDFL